MTTNQNLFESLDHMDLEHQLANKMSIDEYAAKIGKDKDIVTLSFKVNSELAADDLVAWFERGYDFVLDASKSDGEITPGKYLVFVEMDRRSRIPQRIIRLLSDLETLTGFQLKDWIVQIDGEDYDADEQTIRDNMVLNPNEYKMDHESDEQINEFRTAAGLPAKRLFEDDSYLKNLKALAGY